MSEAIGLMKAIIMLLNTQLTQWDLLRGRVEALEINRTLLLENYATLAERIQALEIAALGKP